MAVRLATGRKHAFAWNSGAVGRDVVDSDACNGRVAVAVFLKDLSREMGSKYKTYRPVLA